MEHDGKYGKCKDRSPRRHHDCDDDTGICDGIDKNPLRQGRARYMVMSGGCCVLGAGR